MSSNIISELEEKFTECQCASYQVDGCQLKLQQLPEQTIGFDIDCITKKYGKGRHNISGNRCDFIIAVMENNIASLIPIEFKIGELIDTKKIKRQLEGGIRFIQQHYQGKFKCLPILVLKQPKKLITKQLIKTLIEYNGIKVNIRRADCNQKLNWRNIRGTL